MVTKPRRKNIVILKPGETKPMPAPKTEQIKAEQTEVREKSLLDIISTSWEINTDSNTPLLFLNSNTETLATVPLDKEFLTNFIPAINRIFIADETAPTTWVIRYPEAAGSIPLLSFLKEGKIVSTIPLSEEFLSTIMPILKKLYKEPVVSKQKVGEKLLKWVKKHKVLTTFLIIVLLPVIVSFLVGIYHSILGNY